MPCSFCHQPCGEREFCDEACYDEYQHAQAELRDSIKEEGTGGVIDPFLFDEPPPRDAAW